MTMEPTVGEQDQLDARLRDLLNANEMEVLERTTLDAEWIATHTGEELFDYLVASALAVSDEGGLSALVAVKVRDVIAFTLCAVRRQEPVRWTEQEP